MAVFALTTLSRPESGCLVGNLRTVGIFKTMARACVPLTRDWGDLNEAGYYQFAVVEEVPFGLYPMAREGHSRWFEYCLRKSAWVSLKGQPIGFSEIVGAWYSIG